MWGLSVNTLEYAAFVKKPIYKAVSVKGHLVAMGMRLGIILQFTLFAFAMRNRFRR